MDIKEAILNLIEQRIYVLPKDVFKNVDAPRAAVQKTLDGLEQGYEISRTKHGKYALATTMGIFSGVFEAKASGFGFVRADADIDDIYIARDAKNGALDGDMVLARLKKRQSRHRNLEGEILRILSPVEVSTVGLTKKAGKALIVISDDATVGEIYIPPKDAKGIKPGQKVVVKITRRGQGKMGPEGVITEVLGEASAKGVDILSFARRFGLVAEFDETCEAEAALKKGKARSLKGRLDLRDKLVFTIDGADAKDLDDAISLERRKNGRYLLGVHIADVSQYVRENGPLDREALKRGTSVYLVDRVVPMLPEALSNDLCSLHPGEDKYTLSCIMEIDKHGHVVSHKLAKSVIHSRHKMTYGDVNCILEGDAVLRKQYGDLAEVLEEMNGLAALLRERRFEKGSIDFDLDEAEITLDSGGVPTAVTLRERRDAEKLIEEFMLLCNITVAEQFYDMDIPFIYRLHEQPDADRMKELAIFLRNFGIRVKNAADIKPKAVQNILSEVEGTPVAGIVNNVTLRSLKKAKYDAVPGQHFGLAAPQYCHFTSPIRRYPDLQAHRIVKMMLDGKLSEKACDRLAKRLPEVAQKSSARERNAIEAERAVEDMKMAEYMSERIGREYDGIVSGVTRFGIFVKLENTIEGMVSLASLEDDYYEYNEKQYCVVGSHTKKRITLGDKVRVKVLSVQIMEGEIEFAFAG